MKRALVYVIPLVALLAGYGFAKLNVKGEVSDSPRQIPNSLQVDLDMDGTRENVYIDAPQEVSPLDDELGRARVWYMSNGIVRVVHETSAALQLHIKAKDLTGDDIPELLVEEEDPYSNAADRTAYIYSWNGKGFVNLVGGERRCLVYSRDSGGMIIQSAGKDKPSTLTTYGWDDGEPRYSAHQYYADFYEFKDGRFVLTATKHTQGAYGEKTQALEELGL